MIKIIITYILFTGYLSLHSQISTDSAQLLFNEIYTLEVTAPEDAILRYAQIIPTLDDIVDKGRAYSYIGMVHLAQGRYDSLEVNMEKALNIFENEGYARGVASAHNTLGNADLYRGFYALALEHYQKALPYYEQEGEEYNHTVILNNMAAMFQHNEDDERAEKYLLRALSISKNLEDKKAIANSFNNMSVGYIKQGYFDKAHAYADSAVTMIDEVEESKLAAIMKCNLVRTSINVKKFREAKELLDSLAPQVDFLNNIELTITYEQVVAFYLLETRQYQKAVQHANQALDLLSVFEDRRYEEETLRLLYEAHKNSGNDTEALAAFEKLSEVRKESYMSEKNNRVQELEYIYQNEKKEKQIVQHELALQKSTFTRNLLFIALISAFLIGWTLWMWITKRKRRAESLLVLQSQKLKTLEQEKRIASYDFILQGQENERKRIAQDLHDGLGGLLTAVRRKISTLQNAINDLAETDVIKETEDLIENACDEVRRISHDMMPATLSSLGLEDAIEDLAADIVPQNIAFQLSYDLKKDDLSDSTKIHLYRVIQELITNSVKHSDASTIMMDITTHQNHIQFIYRDNGNGFDIEKAQTGSGLGIRGITTRVQLLEGTFDYVKENGSTFTIIIPLPAHK